MTRKEAKKAKCHCLTIVGMGWRAGVSDMCSGIGPAAEEQVCVMKVV